jgi:hypothetical protein
MSSTAAQLSALPVAVHGGQAMSRLSQADLLHFESMLATADNALETSMKSRAARRTIEYMEEGSAQEVLKSMADAVCALTNAPPPTSLTSKQDAVAWVYRALLPWRDRAVRDATQAVSTPGMSAEALTACMELISKLNTTIGADPLAAASTPYA